MLLIAIEAATIVVFVLIDLLVVFFSKAKVFQSDSFFLVFYWKYVRTEWVTVTNFNIVCFQIRVISSIG